MHYTDVDGNVILDATAGLWCVNAGHAREPIVEAISRSAATLDYAPLPASLVARLVRPADGG